MTNEKDLENGERERKKKEKWWKRARYTSIAVLVGGITLIAESSFTQQYKEIGKEYQMIQSSIKTLKEIRYPYNAAEIRNHLDTAIQNLGKKLQEIELSQDYKKYKQERKKQTSQESMGRGISILGLAGTFLSFIKKKEYEPYLGP